MTEGSVQVSVRRSVQVVVVVVVVGESVKVEVEGSVKVLVG